MLRLSSFIGIGLLLVVMTSSSAKADQLLFDNGPMYRDGPVPGFPASAFAIDTTYDASDAFSLINSASLHSVTAGIWTDVGNVLTSVTWKIGTQPQANDIAMGTSAATIDTLVFGNYQNQWDRSEYSFLINADLAPGTYWLTLGQAQLSRGGRGYWDNNNGPTSSMFTNVVYPGTNSESFQIYGQARTPEPGAVAMVMGLGISGWSVLRRRRLAAKNTSQR